MIKNVTHRIRQVLFLLYFPLHSIIYILSYIIPRNKKIFLYGSFFGESFSDNSKYLFLIANEERPEISHIWISKKREDVNHIKAIGFKAFHKFSLQGVYYAFIAKKHYFTQEIWDTCFFLTHDSVRVNLWHGIPLKKIGADNAISQRISFLERIIDNSPYVFSTKFIVLAPSEYIVPIFSSAFRIMPNDMLVASYPRLLLFLMNRKKQIFWIQKYETDYITSILHQTKQYDAVWAYMPTWRDTNPSFMSEAVKDWHQLDSIARSKNALLIIKAHFMTEKPVNLDSFTNIVFYESKVDFYPILAISDLLITDYSSVFFDYLFLKKRIVFYAFDLEEYKRNSRDLYFDYEEVVFGNIIYSYEELIDLLSSNNVINMTLEENSCREKLLSKMWGTHYIELDINIFSSNMVKILDVNN